MPQLQSTRHRPKPGPSSGVGVLPPSPMTSSLMTSLYVQESVFKRLKQTADVMVGARSMRPFHPSWNNPADAFTWDDARVEKAAKEVNSEPEKPREHPSLDPLELDFR